MYKKILVPVDGSACSVKGLLEAIRFVKASPGATLCLVHVVNEFVMLDMGVGAFTHRSAGRVAA